MARRFSSVPSTFLRYWLPASATFASVLVAALAYLIWTPRLYEANARLILDEKKVSVSDLGRDLAQLSNPVPGGPSPIATQAELVKSQRVLKRALGRVRAQGGEPLPTAAQLSKALRVKIVPATNILDLSYRDRNPALAAELLNAVTQSMIEENIESIRAGARSVKTFLEAKVPQQRAVLRQAEAEENLYRQTNGLVSIADQTRKLVESLSIAESQERDLVAQLREVTVRNSALGQVIDAGTLKDAYESVRAGQDEELKVLRLRLVDLEAKVIDGRSRLGDQHPDLLALVEQRDQTRVLYAQKLGRLVPGGTVASTSIANDGLSQDLTSKLIISEVEQSALGQKLVAVQADRLNLQARLADLPAKQQPLTTLTREREEAEATLKLLQAKLQEATIAEAQLVSNIQIIAEAEPPAKAESPKQIVVLAIAITFGLILMVGVVLLLALLDNIIHDSSEAEELLGQPALGTLPLLPSRLVHLSQAEAFLDDARLVEPYRKLLKTLEFRSAKKLRLLVISSAVDHEGKSTVASHLAAVSAMLCQRTLLIDADLRQPEQHALFGLTLDPGLTQGVEQGLGLSQVIQPSGLKHLSVITCGQPPQRPSLVLEAAAMKLLLEKAAESFDLVIVDTPPIVSRADAIALSRQSDGLVLVVRPEVSTQKGLLQSLTELKKNGVPLMGFVLNGIELPRERPPWDEEGGARPIPNFLQRLSLPRSLRRGSAIALEGAL